MKPFSAWSHSRLLVFESCKFRSWLQFGERIPDPKPAPQRDRGVKIHEDAEKYVRGKLKELPAELAHYSEEFDVLRAMFKKGSVSLEGEWGFDREWAPVDWMAKDVWCRVKADAVAWLTKGHVLVIDFKSGKKYGNEVRHGEQMQLYLLAILLRYPSVDLVTVELWYTDKNEITTGTYTREQGMRYLPGYTKRGEKFTSTTEFPTNPNVFSCKWCPYGPAGTRHCKDGVRVMSLLRRNANPPRLP